jgi:hypothetical protein
VIRPVAILYRLIEGGQEQGEQHSGHNGSGIGGMTGGLPA